MSAQTRAMRGSGNTTDPRIPPSESSATRLRDKPGYAQEDADQEPLTPVS